MNMCGDIIKHWPQSPCSVSLLIQAANADLRLGVDVPRSPSAQKFHAVVERGIRQRSIQATAATHGHLHRSHSAAPPTCLRRTIRRLRACCSRRASFPCRARSLQQRWRIPARPDNTAPQTAPLESTLPTRPSPLPPPPTTAAIGV